MAELLLGCGNRRERLMRPAGCPEGWSSLTTLDIDPDSKPDVEWDMRVLPLPFGDSTVNEIHAYHVLEHVGAQGDFRFFFAQFADLWRILKPEGFFCGVVPAQSSPWVWGDPGHTRNFHPALLTFLDQEEYTKQVGRTALADYRRYYRADFKVRFMEEKDDSFFFLLQAVKPSRIAA